MPILEFGTANDHAQKRRGIVPADERKKAQQDAQDFGLGFLLDERRLDPSKVELIFPDDAPAILRDGLTEYLYKRSKRVFVDD